MSRNLYLEKEYTSLVGVGFPGFLRNRSLNIIRSFIYSWEFKGK